MIKEELKRLGDPRMRRPVLGTVICYVVWLAAFLAVQASRLASGDQGAKALGLALTLAPIAAGTVFFVVLLRRSDEVERAILNSAAAVGFVTMLLAAIIGMHLEVFATGVEFKPAIMVASGMIGWLGGLALAWVRLQ